MFNLENPKNFQFGKLFDFPIRYNLLTSLRNDQIFEIFELKKLTNF